MLTKNAEILLKKLTNDRFEPIPTSEDYFSTREIFSKSPCNDDRQTEIALNELLENNYIGRIADSLIYIETSGFTYSDLKRINFKNKITWNIAVPAILGFIGGSLPNLFAWLTGIIKWLLQLQ